MTAYQKKIKSRIAAMAIIVCLSVGMNVYDAFAATSQLKESIAFSFSCGALIAFSLLALVKIVQYSKMLKDQQLLQIEYNKENDERMKSIRSKAGVPMILLASGAIIFAGVVASYFNETVCITLIIVGMVQLIAANMVKLFYKRIL